MTAQRHHDSGDGSADELADDTCAHASGHAGADATASDTAADPAPEEDPAAGGGGAGGEEAALISPGRLEAFSDGVIAIAITLLSLEIKLPDDVESLLRALASLWPGYVGFVLSFLLVGQVWLNHHAIFARVRSVDQWMLICNLFLLLDVAFLPFATSVLTRSLESGHDERTGAVFYGLVMVVGGLFFNALWRASIRDRSRLRSEVPEAEVRSMTRRFAMGPWLYALAALLGLVSAWLSVVTYVALIVFYMAGHRPRRVRPAGD
ncbi:TMEM175 family protein [uncultured Actinomyces sp.]|uniref:TMEM175 family protein n=1 Tax=uncultured Actinomyces sp. TaxID=249061 RepID=UPI0025F04F86|nr:TMEM175 family protein [uncultured Actinomyces sp.]